MAIPLWVRVATAIPMVLLLVLAARAVNWWIASIILGPLVIVYLIAIFVQLATNVRESQR